MSESRLKKEKEILKGVSNGLKKEEIAKKLDISPRTIERYLEILKAKYGAKNTPHLIAIAMRRKIID